MHHLFRLCVASLIVTAPALGADAPPVSFKEHVAPILVQKCLGCHNAKKAENGLNMATFALMKKGGKSYGEMILEPGDPDSSSLIELVRADGSPRMPYKAPPLSDREIKILEDWVRQGAKFDGPSEAETQIAKLVDPLKNLPKVAVTAKLADAVTALEYTADGQTLAAAIGHDVVLFDAATGKPKKTLGGHPGPLNAVKFTPDGKSLVAAGGRAGMFGTVTVWDLAKGSKRLDFQGHNDAILAVAIAPDGQSLATAGADRMIELWNLNDGKKIRTLKDHIEAVYSVAFAPDGKTLASAAGDRTVKIWDVASGKRTKTFSDAGAELYAVVFGPDGKTVLAGGVDRSIRLWSVAGAEGSLVNSVFAHDGAIIRLIVSADGSTLVSSGEDQDVKLWDLPSLKPRAALRDQPDWPQGLALSPDGSKIAIGRYDGSLALFDSKTGKQALALREAPKAPATEAAKLVRNATLGTPSPRGAARGAKPRVTLNGNGVGLASQVIFREPGLSAQIIHEGKPDPNRITLDLSVARDARVGMHAISVITPLGIPKFQSFAVAADPEISETEPNDDPAQLTTTTALPGTWLGTVAKPGDVDHFRFEAKKGQQLVFQAVSKSLGSGLLGVLSVLDDKGKVLTEVDALDRRADPLLTVTIPRDGPYTLRVTDADYGGSGNHFYRIAAAAAPDVESVYPLAAERGQTTTVEVRGMNLQGLTSVALAVSPDAVPGQVQNVPIELPDGTRPINNRQVVISGGPASVESEPNDTAAQAGKLAAPGAITGKIERLGDVDHFRFEARKGQQWTIETFGRRLGTNVDTTIEILDDKGRSIPRAVVRPLDQTELTFRNHNSTQASFRINKWNNFVVNDVILLGREVLRVEMLPRNPDDELRVWSDRGQRIGVLETTPEYHPIGTPFYKAEIHPPGTTFPSGGVPPMTFYYRNDDGGAGFVKDSRLTFDVPADGSYVIRVADVQEQSGDDYGYALVIRQPRPDFEVGLDLKGAATPRSRGGNASLLSNENPGVPRGGTTILEATIVRLDGFDAPVEVTIEGLPPGVTATKARIERGELSANFLLSASPDAPAFSPPTWKGVARSIPDPSSASVAEHTEIRHDFDPGGRQGGWIVVTPEPNLKVTANPGRIVIRPGERTTMTFAVKRGPAFKGRVPIEVRNLPIGVRVLDIGLNGVLITEKQTERTVFLYADPWVKPSQGEFYAVAKAEAAATEDSSPPIELVVEAGPAKAQEVARKK